MIRGLWGCVMAYRGFALLRLLAPFVVLGLCGCAVVDQFAGRAVQYNLQAEEAQEQALLLNIVRASLRRPMQFTSLQSITGTASASGGSTGAGNYLHPYGYPVTSTTLARSITENLTGNVNFSGGPTFVVPVLDTQEFYQGILNPLPLQAFDYYLQQGFPPELIFDLFVQKIVITRIDNGSCRQFTFTNSVRDELQFGQFQAFADYLIGSGLTAERVNSFVSFGPPIPKISASETSAGDTARILEAYSKASTAGLDIRQQGSGADASYRVQKKNNVFRFCFAKPEPGADWIGQPSSAMYCGNFNRRGAVAGRDAQAETPDCVPGRTPAARRAPAAGAADAEPRDDFDSTSQGLHADGASEIRGIRLSPEFLARVDRLQKARQEIKEVPGESLFNTGTFRGAVVSFKVYTRSTEGILYYLGEVTRRRLFTESALGEPPKFIQVKTGLHHGTLPMSECDDQENGGVAQSKSDLRPLHRRYAVTAGLNYRCENMFVIDNDGTSAGSVLQVHYDGMTFSIPRDNDRAGRTLQVLELAKQLLALNTSAKQLPATSVISITTP
jgi:hypothetical protein